MINGFGERLKAAMKEKNMTAADCAKQTKISTATVGSYVTRGSEPSAGKLAKLASCLGVSTDWLLGLSPAMRPARTKPEKEPEQPKTRIVTKTIIVKQDMADDEICELIAEYLGWTPEAVRAQHNSRKHRFKWVRSK